MAMYSEQAIRIGLTMGDPQGVGPELLVRTVDEWQGEPFLPIALGDDDLLRRAAEQFAPSLQVESVLADALPIAPIPHTLYVVNLSEINYQEMKETTPPGFRYGREVYRYLSTGIELAMAGQLNGLLTAPLAKSAFKAAGIEATGHTEILAEKTGVGSRYAMMLAGPHLRVSLATVHVPIRKVADTLTTERIQEVTRLTQEWLVKYFGIELPRIAVCGLNPHAGEGGMLGTEDAEIVTPAIDKLKGEGLDVSGPHSADSVFHWAREGEYDAVVAMYHDQGLAPFKLVHFYDGVNLTMGLPFVRTSPDHGTAFDIAWKGECRTDSFLAALDMAIKHANNVRKQG